LILSANLALIRVSILFSSIWLVLLFGAKAKGIVLHPDNEPNLLTWTERPSDNVIGRWGTNASCVAIAPNYIITTKHQPDAEIVLDTEVEIGGVTYSIDSIINHTTADLRVVKLNDANLVEYASINFEPNEPNQVAVLGGFGASRGDTLFVVEDIGDGAEIEHTYGYEWLYPSPPTVANGIAGWGTNKVVSTASTSSELIVCQFDPNSTISVHSTDYECTLAEHDSGGGWFLPDEDGGWKVIGLSRGVAPIGGQSWFMYTDEIIVPVEIPQYPESITIPPVKYNHLDAVRVSSYAEWIVESVYLLELGNLAGHWLNDDCDEANNYCNGADVFRDGIVNMKDFGLLAGRWLEPLN
jgi:hypothetical protein